MDEEASPEEVGTARREVESDQERKCAAQVAPEDRGIEIAEIQQPDECESCGRSEPIYYLVNGAWVCEECRYYLI